MTNTLYLVGVIGAVVVAFALVGLVALNRWYWRRYELKHQRHQLDDDHIENVMRSEQGFIQTWQHN